MKIVLFGATGSIGKKIAEEALRRGHEVTAVVRDQARAAEMGLLSLVPADTKKAGHLALEEGDILVPDSIARLVQGQDLVISAYGPRFGEEDELQEATRSLIEGVKRGGVRRLIAVGGAGGLEVAPGVKLMDTSEFPEEVRPLARAHEEALSIYQASNLEWTVLSPPALIEPGKRTGMFRLGLDRLVTDERDNSRITAEDYAAALLDEAEDPYYVGTRFTVGY
ncbi:MAG: NAD(P)H-binding protein [Paenibacillaceae bacterium]|uniref:NAD(P)H-binding protein n=1 Tax=Paenibacillus mellifer TaxID=2937794 RepID=A0A9X1Y2H3_9BACL|nr:NAD(P)H-binding protein [Paenibacillus mellifer]MBW4840193.1 NAD(P)H-binding protein [Paenibacillaceae bacterium]MCK8490185.1 NAD(P)H-binding protein [Paenibacillus mellifer]